MVVYCLSCSLPQESVCTLVRAAVEEEETAALSHLTNTPMTTRELMQVGNRAPGNEANSDTRTL